MIDRKEMEARRAQLVTARDQHLSNANAAHGQTVELDYWLAKLDEPEKPTDGNPA